MYNPTFEEKIEVASEKEAIVKYCKEQWKINKDIDFNKLVSFLVNVGTRLAKGHFNGDYIATILLDYQEKEFEKELEILKDGKIPDDYLKARDLNREVMSLNRDIRQNSVQYYEYMPSLLKIVKEKFGKTQGIYPNNWRKYNNDENFEEPYVSPDSFLGMNGKKIMSTVWQDFHDHISLSSVAYHCERDRKPFETLVGAIVCQGYAIEFYNNTVEMLKEIDKLYTKYGIALPIDLKASEVENEIMRKLIENIKSKKNDEQKIDKADIEKWSSDIIHKLYVDLDIKENKKFSRKI
jgi:hypothetical protein